MNLASLLTGVWFILLGADWLKWVTISASLLGLLAFIIGVVWLVSGFYPIEVWKRR